MNLSAYIPCYNNIKTLPRVIAGVREQSTPVDELFMIDDGSTDDSVELANSLGVEVLRQTTNRGRGAARTRAMERARGEFVLCVDATNVLEPGFVSQALPWFEDFSVAAIFGRVVECRLQTAVGRWRGRHLFKSAGPSYPVHHSTLITYGTIVRRVAVESVGGYRSQLRHTEDADLGERLLARGYDVIFDPRLQIRSVANNSMLQSLERYWRWHVGLERRPSVRDYISQVAYSVKVMAREDLREGDWKAASISLISPHYSFYRSLPFLKYICL